MDAERERTRVVDFYTEVVLPALAERLDQVFPEFGWRRDPRGWVATNEEHTHARLGVRAERVVAHGPAPRGFLVHGGEPMLWTAYLAGGELPRGMEFVRVVGELADRAGVDAAPLERETPRDRRAELLEEFFKVAQRELVGDRGQAARAYLEARGLSQGAIGTSGLGVVPPFAVTKRALRASGFSDEEVEASGLLADGRWPGRLSGAWRDERGKIGTFWARAVDDDVPADKRYLYLRGATWSKLPPYGWRRNTRELVLVEGFLDYHQLTVHGAETVGALGGTRTSTQLFEQLRRLGVKNVVLCLDNDGSGRDATVRAVENAVRAKASSAIFVVGAGTGDAKDPDALVREHGIGAWRQAIEERECGVLWRTKEFVKDVTADTPLEQRREALRRAGAWLQTLPRRLALEQEDAVKLAAERCGYSPEAARRAFHDKFSRDVSSLARERSRRIESGVEL
jgi:DNA primase